ncbi:MAG: type I 3-dehydroquinate dehydratase [Candidatus Lokiarchaeota archaeon]|nr:type I 3-dehydroquinate dehydratase [Candidatus Lokiarchaeota archaeon]MBD3200589.1 type I 3-dehydroquinate dehydratase [Candidatus Lokiarchaeota archaeon]
MAPKICVALPIKDSNLKKNLSLIQEASNESADLIELRLDYIGDFTKITSKLISTLIRNSKVPIISTFRHHFEGGNLSTTNSQHFEIISNIIEAKPSYIDLEMGHNEEFFQKVLPSILDNNIDLIFSHHNFTNTPSIQEINSIINSFEQKLNNIDLINNKIFSKFIFKLIFTATSFEDNLKTFVLCKRMKSQKKNVIIFCMGQLGIISRLLSAKISGLFTYGSITDETAPGQLHIQNMRRFYKLIK